ncbi:MAG: hypothetical protein KDA60_21480, partial [Planctomycetales bacterium]|nr:hypothetical protein [Planctomycetales bacterium]
MPRILPLTLCVYVTLVMTTRLSLAQPRAIPEPLQPWTDWATWNAGHPNCPSPYNDNSQHICFWPSKLNLQATSNQANWTMSIIVYERARVPLPGDLQTW